MSLANLIKNLHRSEEQGTPSLQPTIEQYFMRTANEFDEEKHCDRLTRFHPSQISYWGVCSRAYYLGMKREELGLPVEVPEPFETTLLRVFEHGHSIHAMYQDKVLGPAKVLYGKWKKDGEIIEGYQPDKDWAYVEPRLWWPEKRISGYCDGFVRVNDEFYVLEIKSINDQGFRFLKRNNEPKPYHVRQAQIYVHAPHDLEKKFDVKGVILLYINKATGEEIDFFVPNDISMVQPLFDQIDQAVDALDQSFIPPRVEDCKSAKSKRAKDCKVCQSCFSFKD